MKKLKIRNIFLLNLIFGTSTGGILLRNIICIGYILLLASLLKPDMIAHCIPPTESIPTTSEAFDRNNDKIINQLTSFSLSFRTFLEQANNVIPVSAQIDLGPYLVFKKEYIRSLHAYFPLNKISDFNNVINYYDLLSLYRPDGFADGLGNRTNNPYGIIMMETIIDPSKRNVQNLASFVSAMYFGAIGVLQQETIPYLDEKAIAAVHASAWRTLQLIMPLAVDLQITDFNRFLEYIKYPCRVEDFLPHSIYERAGMQMHQGKLHAFDPYGTIIPEQKDFDYTPLQTITTLTIVKPIEVEEWYNDIILPSPQVFKETYTDQELEAYKSALVEVQRGVMPIMENQEELKYKAFEAKVKSLRNDYPSFVQLDLEQARRNQMLVHAGLIICTGTIIGIAAGVGYQICKVKYGI